VHFVLRGTGNHEWSIYTEDGRWIYTLPIMGSSNAALDYARAWITSWSGSTIRMEDEQEQQTDRVPSKT